MQGKAKEAVYGTVDTAERRVGELCKFSWVRVLLGLKLTGRITSQVMIMERGGGPYVRRVELTVFFII